MTLPAQPSSKSSGNSGFTIADLDFDLPEALIAQRPPPRREDARLMVLHRQRGHIEHATIPQLVERLRADDLLVLNDTKVLPARFVARRRTGGVVPGLFLEEVQTGRWRVLLQGAGRLRHRESMTINDASGEELSITVREPVGPGEWIVEVDPPDTAESLLERFGQTPLPPYIRRGKENGSSDGEDRARYQTVYARRSGAVAAPTAGLHLSSALLDTLRDRGVQTAFVTLHVGVGTFKPIAVDRPADHVMHDEWFELPQATAEAVRVCRERGGRVVAVGTTSSRVLESAVQPGTQGVAAQSGRTRMFIYPPYRFAVVDALLTNFHLPRSTLLAMVMAFGGVDFVRAAYAQAVADRYRFYSYGDAMFLE